MLFLAREMVYKFFYTLLTQLVFKRMLELLIRLLLTIFLATAVYETYQEWKNLK